MARRLDSTLYGPASWAVLALAALLLCLSNGRTAIAAAPWWALMLMLRFVRGRRPLPGLAIGLAVTIGANLLVWRGMIPVEGRTYAAIAATIGTLAFLPFVADRLLVPRIGGFAATFVLPLAAVAADLLNTVFSPYGSWGSLAYTQLDDLPLVQIVSVTGGAGVVFLIAWFAAVVNWAWEQRFVWARIRFEATAFVAVLVLIHLLGGVRLGLRDPSPSVRVAGLTVRTAEAGNLTRRLDADAKPAELKAARAALAALHDTLFQRSEREVRAGARIVLWSEANGLTLKQDEPALLARARELAVRYRVWLFLALATTTPGSPRYENQLVMIDPDGSLGFRYHKAKPVPGDPEMGADRSIPKPVATRVGKLAGAICFDMDFPGLIRKAGSLDADILIAPSSDWRAIDPAHTRMAVFRGIENGCAVVRQTNQGLSMATDCRGRVLAAADFFATGDHRMVALVPTQGARTFYARVGDLFAWLCVLALAGVVVMAQGLRRL
ncbi:MAG TPA: nitrilase-related carbon-nitrogen hydrolase [Candidatus Eisenbacteria bacterium]|jgi:apolipoprotein N-acyltransferase